MFFGYIFVPEFSVLEQVECTCIVGFKHEEPGLCVCCFSELENWKKSSLHVDFLVRITCSFFCENDGGICMLFF